MCNNNGICGCLNNNWWWIVILVLLLCNCGGGCGCGNTLGNNSNWNGPTGVPNFHLQQREEAANRFLSFIMLDMHRSDKSGRLVQQSPPGFQARIAAGRCPDYMSKGSMPRTGWPTSDR